MRNFIKSKKGEVVIESSIVLTIVVIFLIVLIYMGLMVYQQTLVSVVANQAAANIAQVYSNDLKDPFTGYIDPSSLNNAGMISKMKDDAYQEVIAEKAQWFSHYRLRRFKILNTGDPKVEVSIETKEGELMKSQIVVTVEDQFVMPIAGFFGSEGKLNIKATGRADCFDVLDYKNIVDIVSDAGNSDPDNPDKKADIVDVTENYKVTFRLDRETGEVYTIREVMQNSSFRTTAQYNSDYYKKNRGYPTDPVDADAAHFYGWEMANGEAFTEDTVVKSNIDVYAVWKYVVRFDPNGGTVTPTSMEVVKGQKLSSLPTPIKSGAIFDGWYTSDGKKVTTDTVITSDVTLKAQWKYTVTFMNGSTEVAQKTVVEGKAVSTSFPSLPTVTKSGREFYRWEDESGKEVKLDTKVTKNVTAYAKWKYTVTLNASGGKVQGESKKVYHVAPGGTFYFASDTYKPTRSGYTFDGWYVGSTKYNSSITITGDVTATAKWSCTVTFKNGSTTVKTIQVIEGNTIGSVLKELPSASQSGKKFYRWEINGVQATTSTVIKEATTVNAKYQYIVIFMTDGTEYARKHVVPNDTLNFSTAVSAPSKTNYSFQGWYSGSTKYSGNRRITSDLTVTASWSFNCPHPSDRRYEVRREGTYCEGYTIYYNCGQCNQNPTTGYQAGVGHSYKIRCNTPHRISYFNGIAVGGCGVYHKGNNVTCYCMVCEYCYKSRPYIKYNTAYWCGTHAKWRTSVTPYNGVHTRNSWW